MVFTTILSYFTDWITEKREVEMNEKIKPTQSDKYYIASITFIIGTAFHKIIRHDNRDPDIRIGVFTRIAKNDVTDIIDTAHLSSKSVGVTYFFPPE